MSDELVWLKNWNGKVPNTYEGLRVAVLVEIREELRKLNTVMQCSNVSAGFRALAKMAARDERAFKRRVDNAVAKRIKRAK